MSKEHDIFILGIETMETVKISEVKANICPETASWRIWNTYLENYKQCYVRI